MVKGVVDLPYVQCPYCDSIHINKIYENQYKCEYCRKYFDHYKYEDSVVTY